MRAPGHSSVPDAGPPSIESQQHWAPQCTQDRAARKPGYDTPTAGCGNWAGALMDLIPRCVASLV